MRQFVGSLVVIACLTPHAAARQPAATAAAGARVSACALLTKDLMLQVTPYTAQARDLVMQIPPTEDPVGRSGSACNYGGVTLQIDPFPPATFEKLRNKEWISVPGVGDRAYFRDNKGMWAELYAIAGARVVTVQMDVPTGGTAASIQPRTVALAKAILAKLK